jgi:hypothetical protein
MAKSQRQRRGVKDERLPEFTEAFSRRYQVLLFLSWLKVTSGPKERKDGSWNWLRHAKYAAWLLLDSLSATGALNLSPERKLELYRKEVMRVIGFQSLMKNEEFFVQLGKCLTGEIDRQLVDERDIDIGEIVLFHPELSAGDAVSELQRRGHREMTEENFRMWKMRLRKAKEEYDAVQADAAYDLAHGK